MIEPIQFADELFPYIVVNDHGKYIFIQKDDWNNEKELAYRLRTIDYLMQFPRYHGHIGLQRMIEYYSIQANQYGNAAQKRRFRNLLIQKNSWL